ncbi:5-formyltetrahydrofolate cyclo-ligase [Pediococcus cellicola]|uniref:5-formyltetrahydrofolate cyclo-ligase n=2 Tax=Pediococcus cellicola TaxID=319652 RepID=A0A0R2J0J4_9LACO|nr:5-formyltetrahydrofolate cyclo-ligase [Pediococcus cellicola]
MKERLLYIEKLNKIGQNDRILLRSFLLFLIQSPELRDTAMQVEKKKQRQVQISRLQAMDETEKKREQLSLYEKLFASKEWQQAKTVATTMSGKIEVDTRPIMQQARYEHKTILIPKTLAKWQMAFFEYLPTTKLEKTKFGIPEPVGANNISKSDINLILVPGLGFADQGNYRLGFGGGYYDRFLRDYHGATISLVLSAQHFKTAAWPIEAHDIPINKLIKSEAN